jgi:hypothetical protein
MSSVHLLDSVPLLEWATTQRCAVFECAPALARYVALESALKPGDTSEADLSALRELGVLSVAEDRAWFAVRDACRSMGAFYILSVFHTRKIPYRVFVSDERAHRAPFERVLYESVAIRACEFIERVRLAQDSGVGPLLADVDESMYALFDKVNAPSLCALFADLSAAPKPAPREPYGASGCAVSFAIIRAPWSETEDDLWVRTYLSHPDYAPKRIARMLLALRDLPAAEALDPWKGGESCPLR